MRTAFGIALAAILLLLTSCSSNSNSTDSVSDQAQISHRLASLVDHFNNGDAKAILDDDVPPSARRTCSDKDARDTVSGAKQQLQALGGKLSLKSVNDVVVTGNRATANVVFATGVAALPETPPIPVPFIKDGGSWKLDPGEASGCNGLIPTALG